MNPAQSSPRFGSQPGGRRPTSSAGPAPLHHHHEPDTEPKVDQSPNLGQRSVSLTTLQPTVIQPRMAQLETLEAKMASIEVSLSSTPRRKKNGSLTGINIGSSIRSIPKELAVKELENLRNALRDKENIIQSLKGQLTVPGIRLNAIRNCNNNGNIRELTEVEKKQAEDRLSRLRTDVDNKRLTIKNLKMALERLDITDNIDVRIQQAELEYQLGREELNLLTLLEETRALHLCIEESNKISSESHTLYSCIGGNEYVILHAIEIDYDAKSPKFGAGQRDSMTGLYVDWALEESNMRKDDRLIEVNGKIVLNKNQDDLTRLLAAAPDPAQIVVLRIYPENGENISSSTNTTKEVSTLRCELEMFQETAEEARKAKEVLKSENIRLTHRISYLEEQVSDLLSRKPSDSDIRILTPTPVISKSTQNVTNINITSQSPANTPSPNPDRQIFQKGNQKSALAPQEPKDTYTDRRSKSSLSNVSNTHIPAPAQNGDYNSQNNVQNRHRHRSSRSGMHSPVGHPVISDKITYRKHNHHHHHREKDYSSETNSAIEQVKRYNKRNHENHRYSSDFSKTPSEKEYVNDIMDQSYKKATKIVHDLTRNNNLYEKHRQKCISASEKYNVDLLRHYNARKSTSVIDFRSEVHIGPRYDSKSVEDLDVADIPRNNELMYKKVQDARSVKSLDFDSDCNSNGVNCRLNGHVSDTNYASEPSSDSRKIAYCQNAHENSKPRPTPPKKPVRLSLHKTHSLQSVETNPEANSKVNDRKSMKRNYKGEIPIVNVKSYAQNGDNNGYRDQINWNYRRNMENNLENGSWC